MAFVSLTETEIATGKAVSNLTLTKVKDNLDDLNGRVSTIEAEATSYAPITFNVNGRYDYSLDKYILTTTTNFKLQITGVYLICVTAGSSGTTEVELEYKNGSGSWTSCLATKPTVASSAGDYAISTNGIVHSTNNIVNAGGLLRLKITQAQVNGLSFIIRIDYIKP